MSIFRTFWKKCKKSHFFCNFFYYSWGWKWKYLEKIMKKWVKKWYLPGCFWKGYESGSFQKSHSSARKWKKKSKKTSILRSKFWVKSSITGGKGVHELLGHPLVLKSTETGPSKQALFGQKKSNKVSESIFIILWSMVASYFGDSNVLSSDLGALLLPTAPSFAPNILTPDPSSLGSSEDKIRPPPQEKRSQK